MKRLFLALALTAITVSMLTAGCLEENGDNGTPTSVQWVSYSTALEQAETTGTPVMVDFYADWCGPCQQMDETTYKNRQVIQQIADSFTAVKVNVDQRQDLATQYGIRSVPTIVYLKENGSEIHRTVGYRSASQLMDDMDRALQKT